MLLSDSDSDEGPVKKQPRLTNNDAQDETLTSEKVNTSKLIFNGFRLLVSAFLFDEFIILTSFVNVRAFEAVC